MLKIITLLFLLLGKSFGVIYHLNESEYSMMPKLNLLEDPAGCERYCIVRLRLRPGDGELGRTLREYSAHKPTHFDHLNIRRGVCASHCASSIEDCARASIQPDSLQADVQSTFCTDDLDLRLDRWDVTVATISLLLIGLVALASLLAAWSKPEDYPNKFLMGFSLQHNWNKLIKKERSNPNTPNLKCLDGIRVLCTSAVAAAHTFLGFCIMVSNERDLEESFHFMRYTGAAVMAVQTFFIMSAFLTAYNLQKELDAGCKPSLGTTVKRILKRWLRLTPVFAFSLAFSTSVIKLLGTGPQFKHRVAEQLSECRRDWLSVLFYLVNYMDNTKCKPETWSLAADFHMSVIGIALIVLLKGRKRILALTLLLLLGVVSSAAQTYFRDLDPWIMSSPEVLSRMMYGNPTFDYVYKRTHTNLASYVMGLAGGLFVWHFNKTGRKPLQYKEYKYLVWLSVLGILGLIGVNASWYNDEPRLPLMTRVLFAATYKTAFGFFLAVLVIATTLRVVDSKMLRKHMWTPLARVSYSGYMMHVDLLRIFSTLFPTTMYFSKLHLVLSVYALIILEFLCGLLIYLFVEAPVQNLVQRYILDRVDDRKKEHKTLKAE